MRVDKYILYVGFEVDHGVNTDSGPPPEGPGH